MCGIAGAVTRSGKVDPASVQRMVRAANHRGPDDEGLYVDGRCVLGHTRLAIIDPAGGRQPMVDCASGVAVTFNGEVFNYKDLRSSLERTGVVFQTASDTEVLLRAYLAYGTRCVHQLNGQFAFAIWDRRTAQLFAARDRFGEKPFYYAHDASGTLWFASELKQLIESQRIHPVIDLDAVASFLVLDYVPPGRTIYTNVHTLGPAQTLEFGPSTLTRDTYWSPRLSHGPPISFVEAGREVRALLARSVERQLTADVPVGATLSGGLDSATIVALMSQLGDSPPQTFSVGFPGLVDERPRARLVSSRWRTAHSELSVDPDAGSLVREMASIYDEPFADSSNIPTYLVSRFARSRTRVVLSGDGGDELFGGYRWYGRPESAQRLTRWPLVGIALDAASAAATLLQRRGSRYVEAHHRLLKAQTLLKAARAGVDRFDQHLLSSTRGDWVETLGVHHRKDWINVPPTHMSGLDRATYFDLLSYLSGDILVKVDRATMAWGLESRAPFLDVHLVEFVLSLPTSYRISQSPKSLLRAACRDLWPPGYERYGKVGFGSPVARWVNEAGIKQLITEAFGPRSLVRELVPQLPLDHRSIRGQHQWTIVCLYLWLLRWSPHIRGVTSSGSVA